MIGSSAVMKHFIVLLLVLLTSTAFAEDQERSHPVVVHYSLNLNFDAARQKIIVHLRNKSATDIQIRRDASSSPFLAGRIKLFAFEDAENLTRIPLSFSFGSEPELISVQANGELENEIALSGPKEEYCRILSKTSILIFWVYSYHDDKYILFQGSGVFRIKKSDMNCDN